LRFVNRRRVEVLVEQTQQNRVELFRCVDPCEEPELIRSGNWSSGETVEHLPAVEVGPDDLSGGVD
jgi:hypothetical protein